MIQAKDNWELLYNREAIREETAQVAGRVEQWVGTQLCDDELILAPILRGGFFFGAELGLSLGFSVEVCPIQASSYSDEANNVQGGEVVVDLRGLCPQGRCILLVDEICDSGKTLKAVAEQLYAHGAREVKTAALIVRSTAELYPDFYGFEYNGPEWLVGYGMKDENRYRNSPDIFRILPGG